MTSLKSAEMISLFKKRSKRYEHSRKYEVYDIKRRRIL
jgi:hypothetical protein